MRATPKHVVAPVVVLLMALLLTLGLVAEPAEADPESHAMDEFIALMDRYLSLSDRWVAMMENDKRAVFLALEGITEIYEDQGDKRQAITHLNNLLDKHGDHLAVRNALRFKLRDLYRELGEPQKALEQLDLIVRENAG